MKDRKNDRSVQIEKFKRTQMQNLFKHEHKKLQYLNNYKAHSDD